MSRRKEARIKCSVFAESKQITALLLRPDSERGVSWTPEVKG